VEGSEWEMSENLGTSFAGWVSSRDLPAMTELCRRFNRGRIYEIFGEYCGLTSHILREKDAHCWLNYENGRLKGFALGRNRKRSLRMCDTFVFEEIWGQFDGISTELGQLNRNDIKRVNRFKELIASLERFPIVLRASVDNRFAHLIVRSLKANWVNGLILAEKTMNRKVRFSAPTGYKFRMFEGGDEYYMSRIHRRAFEEDLSPEDYKSWATKANCHTVVATEHRNPVGFIIAEKRRYGSIGDFNIAVQPVHQRKGIGSALLRAAFNIFVEVKVKRVIADYWTLNTAAHYLYQKHGFEPKRIYNYFLYDQCGRALIKISALRGLASAR